MRRQQKYISRQMRRKIRARDLCTRFRGALRLPTPQQRVESARFSELLIQSSTRIVSVAVHRFEESIAGRAYLIEVAAVTQDRWRAYIVRVPGVPTALMPFYGATPDEAARLLCQWLTRAHERAAASSS
jgi:hypothetical protein